MTTNLERDNMVANITKFGKNFKLREPRAANALRKPILTFRKFKNHRLGLRKMAVIQIMSINFLRNYCPK